MKASTYKKSHCKQELEHHIMEEIKSLFLDLKKATDQKNDQMKYIEHNLHQADQAIKKLSEMRVIFRNLMTKIGNMKKLPDKKKQEYNKLINETYVRLFF